MAVATGQLETAQMDYTLESSTQQPYSLSTLHLHWLEIVRIKDALR